MNYQSPPLPEHSTGSIEHNTLKQQVYQYLHCTHILYIGLYLALIKIFVKAKTMPPAPQAGSDKVIKGCSISFNLSPFKANNYLKNFLDLYMDDATTKEDFC